MIKRILFTYIFAMIGTMGFAHDGGHGPKIKDVGKHGGVVAAVVLANEGDKGAKAKLVYKSELVRLKDGTIQFYIYDKDMNPLDVKNFEKTGKGVVEYKKKKKYHELPFDLKVEGKAFVGTAPKSPRKPFSIDIRINEGKKLLIDAFENLD